MSGVRIGHELLTFVGEHERIRPLRDSIVIEPEEYAPSEIVAVAYAGRPLRGRVLAVGPGCYPIQYRNQYTKEWSFSVPKGARDMSRPSKAFRPCDVKVGDTVELGGIEIGGYLHTRIRWGDKDVVVCREEDVCMVVE